MNSLNYDMRPISPDGWVDYLNAYNKRVESRMDEILDVLAQNRRRLREMHNGLMSIEPPPLTMLQQSINQFAEVWGIAKKLLNLEKNGSLVVTLINYLKILDLSSINSVPTITPFNS